MSSASDAVPATATVRPRADAHVTVQNLTIAYGSFVLLREIDFVIGRGDVFAIMGASGCGKTTLMRAMIGLKEPAAGAVLYDRLSFWEGTAEDRQRLMQRFGVLYQQGALWSSMTLAENVALPLGEFTDLGPAEIRDLVSFKLALVGLAGFEDYYPAEISGGMRKRAGLARAIALDPEILFFDEPSAGLDPISSRHLDELILELRASMGATVVMVSHELASIFAIANNSVFLDGETRTQLATGDPHRLLAEAEDPKVREFLTRGEAHRNHAPKRRRRSRKSGAR